MNHAQYDRPKLRRDLLILTGTLLLAGLLMAGHQTLTHRLARAAGPYAVNSLADTPDAVIDGVCDDGTGACTLRAAMQEAMTDPGGVAHFTVSGTITLTANLPPITATLVISGPGADQLTIDGVCSYTHFYIAAGTTARISDLTLINGRATHTANWSPDTAAGGAIHNRGNLTLNGVRITGCIAEGGPYDGFGGAIYAEMGSGTVLHNCQVGSAAAPNQAGAGGALFHHYGTMSVYSTSVSYNSATGSNYSGGGFFNYGGALLIQDSAVWGNHAESGGGLDNLSGALTISNTTIASNTANLYGGGIRGYSFDWVPLTLDQATLISNTAGHSGGGLYLLGSSGVTTMTNSTVARNAALLQGGGIENLATLQIANSTISGNQAGSTSQPDADGGGIHNSGVLELGSSTVVSNTATGAGGGLYAEAGSTAEIRNALLAHNLDATGNRDCFNAVASPDPVTSFGYNLVQFPGNCLFTATGDITATVPLLAPLAHNGGPTWTHALLPASPAIDQASCTDLAGNPITADQRGAPRPADLPEIPNAESGCDIGAFEYPLPTIELVKLASADLLRPGDPLTYTIRLTNTSSLTLTATITDFLPAQVSPGGLLTWAPTLPPGSPAWFSTAAVTVHATCSGTLANVVHVTSREGAAGWYTVTVDVVAPLQGLVAANDGPTALGDSTTLTATLTQGTHVAYQWNFGDGQALPPGAQSTVTHTYPAAGPYTALVTATNLASLLGATTTVFVDGIPPTSTIDDPLHGQVISQTQYTLHGTAADDLAGLALVEVSTDGAATWHSASGAAAWLYTWTLPLENGVPHLLMSRATDRAGNVETPTFITVTVDTLPPGVAIISPTAGAMLTGTTALIEGVALDPAAIDSVSQVQVSTDHGLTWYDATGTATWRYTWTLPLENRIDHLLLARATDDAGNIALSGPVTITVESIAPAVTAVYPSDAAEGVPLGTSLVISFTESMNPASLSLSTVPDPGMWTLSWNGQATVLIASHAPFDWHTNYSATVHGCDLAGNPMGSALTWHFVTDPFRCLLPVILK